MAHAPRYRPIARLAIAPARMELALEQVERLVALHRTNALVDLPSLKNLQSSRLCHGLVVEDNQLFVQLSLEESSQLVLALDPPSSEDPEPDPFAADVARVMLDRESVEARLLLCLSHGVSPVPSAASSSHDPGLQELRMRIQRGLEPDGSVSFAGWPLGAKLHVGELPRHLPNGPLVTIRACVRGLRRNWVTLDRIEVEASSTLSTEQREALSRRRQIQAFRQGANLQGPDAAARLARAMELREVLHFRAVAALDWSTGRSSALALLSLSDSTTCQSELEFSHLPRPFDCDDGAGGRELAMPPHGRQVQDRE